MLENYLLQGDKVVSTSDAHERFIEIIIESCERAWGGMRGKYNMKKTKKKKRKFLNPGKVKHYTTNVR